METPHGDFDNPDFQDESERKKEQPSPLFIYKNLHIYISNNLRKTIIIKLLSEGLNCTQPFATYVPMSLYSVLQSSWGIRHRRDIQ